MARTLVSFHAHPDDEAIATGGTIARAAADGHRVVLVFATRGELGEVADGVLGPAETLGDRRTQETEAAAAILGAARVVFLNYRDSGMKGEPTNDDDGTFWTADVDEAAARLAAVLDEESADILTIYDDHGGYHHPDHVQVHRVGVRASELAGTPTVYEATADRDYMMETIAATRAEFGDDVPEDMPEPPDFANDFSPSEVITTRVDVREYVPVKRAALAAHATQIDETSIFLTMPDEVFTRTFGTEWFIRRGAPVGTHETWLFPDE